MPPPDETLWHDVGGFVHEIKNHVNTLSLNLQLLAEDFEGCESPRDRQAAERINQLGDECRAISELANDFLKFVRGAELDLKPTALGSVITRLVDFFSPTAKSMDIDLKWYPAPELPKVNLDVEMFKKVLLNLMLNAQEAMPDGGTLILQARSHNGSVVLEVIDTGAGMDGDWLKTIFTPFTTNKEGGTGLGLATSRKIVEAHGGSISVESELGRGSKFTIRLPVAS